MKAVLVLLALLSLTAAVATDASGDWASAQSPRGVRVEPNDFWYWHKPGIGVQGKSPPLSNTDIVYDASHTLLWLFGDNYLNLPRAWAISRCGDSSRPVLIASYDTEYDIDHYDLGSNVWINRSETLGRAGVDDDGNGLIDDTKCVSGQSSSVFGKVYGDWRNTEIAKSSYSTNPTPETHGTIVMSLALAVTNNEDWWVGREYNDYIADLDKHQTGIPGITWNAKGVLSPWWNIAGTNASRFAEYVCDLAERGENIRVASFSVSGSSQDLIDKLLARNILPIFSAGNHNWGVNDCPGGTRGVISAVDCDYHRTKWYDQDDKGACYREGTNGKRADFVGYAPNSGDAWFYSGGTGKYVYFSGPEQVLTLYRTYVSSGAVDYDSWSDVVASGSKLDIASLGVPGFAGRKYSSGNEGNRSVQSYATSKLGTSGSAPQAAGIAALLFNKWPWLTPEQCLGAIRRGCVNIDSYNTANCCLGTEVQCAPGTGTNDTGSCAGLLGAGRLDAYRALTLWGTIPADTTLAGDIFVSGDVLIKTGRTVTVSAGTHFFIAPDDITYLDAWNTENRYDMSGSTGDGNDYLPSQTNAAKIQFRIEGTGRLVILGSPDDPVVFDSFVNDAQTASDWTGIDVVDGNSITHANGATSIQILHSTNGEF